MFTDTKYPIRQNGNYRYVKVDERCGHPAIVLLHGMFGGLSNFEYLVDHLKDDFPLFVPEIPLYQLQNSQLNISCLAEWLNSVLDDQGLDTVILLGNSMGGHIALEYALKNSSRVHSMVLTGSSGLFENEFGTSMPRRDDRQYIRERAELTFYDSKMVTESLVDEIMEVVNSKSKLLKLLRLARATHNYNMESLLSKIKVPTLLVWGENDHVTPPEVARTFEEKLPNAILKWIPKCGHAPMMERPEQFLNIVRDFLMRQDWEN